MGCTPCLQNPESPVPVEIDNRPGLSAIVYRIGAFASFRAALLDAISATPELAGLRTRLSDDYSITLLELWAAVADVLTFYQERVANEAYLRTATLRDSVLRLVRLIDYQLQPGLAATALLAFTLEPGASVTIPSRLRVQSVPAGNASPQKYETIESIAANARFNSLAILPAPETVTPLTPGRISEIFAPGADMVAFAATLAPGDRLVAYTSSAIEFLTVAAITVQGDRIAVQWTIPLSQDLHEAATGATTTAGLFKVGRTFRLFGYDAPASFIQTVMLNNDPRSLRAQLANTPPLTLNSAGFYLDARYQGIKPGAALLTDVVDTTGTAATYYATVQTVTEGTATRGPRTGVATLLSASSSAGLFTSPIAPPSGAPAVAPGTTGVLNGTYTIVVTFTSATAESNPSPASAPITVVNQNIDVSAIPRSLDPTVTGRNIYGFKSGVSFAYQLIGTLNDNSTTTFTVRTDQPWTTTALPSISTATIYELIGPQLRLLPAAFPSRISSPDLYLSGRRNGWNTIEVGRAIVKGVIQPGVTVGVNDLAIGRKVILVDADPSTAVSATVVATELAGDQPWLGPANVDVQALIQKEVGPDQTQQITALVSPPFDSGSILLRNPRLQMQVTIGQHPPQIISLSPPITIAAPRGVAVSDVAAALEAAIRSALPEAPEFVNALILSPRVRDGPTFLVAVPGVITSPITFAPTAADPDTVVDLGLDATHARYHDGVISRPLNLLRADRIVKAILDYFTVLGLADPPLVFSATGRVLGMPSARFERPVYLHVTIAPTAPINLDSYSAVLLGNVAQASQGETVANEIVGEGNGSAVFQSFPLRKKPITFLLGDGPHGAQSSLAVAAGGIQWQEVATLYGAAPTDQVFVTRIADDKTLTMEFGDGLTTGARLPTGRANIVATYRQGVGLAGRVGANSLTSLLDQVNGLKRVTNPLAADGGADPQVLEDARTNAPSTVRTFGRAVSLQDFEDVALATGEIAKANATWVWSGLHKTIFLTVAAQNDDKLSPDGIHKLWAALLAHRDPNHQLLIDNFVRVPIIVTATLTANARYSAAAVQVTAFNALLAALSFDQLQLAQPIYLSSMYGVLQSVPGVTAVDITDLNFKSQDPAFRKAHGADDRKPQPHLFMLGARPGTAPGVTVLPAELAWVDVPAQDLVLTVTGGSGA
jgi:hypothetical protein